MPDPSYWAKAERDGDALTITVHIEDIPKHHNFAGVAVGLATIGVSLCVPTDDARGVLEALARGGDDAR